MNEVLALYPGREIHVILDNLNTHKPKHDAWRLGTPTYIFTTPQPMPAGLT